MCSRAIQFIAGLVSVGIGALSSHAAESYDVVIYGGTSPASRLLSRPPAWEEPRSSFIPGATSAA